MNMISGQASRVSTLATPPWELLKAEKQKIALAQSLKIALSRTLSWISKMRLFEELSNTMNSGRGFLIFLLRPIFSSLQTSGQPSIRSLLKMKILQHYDLLLLTVHGMRCSIVNFFVGCCFKAQSLKLASLLGPSDTIINVVSYFPAFAAICRDNFLCLLSL